MSEIGSWEISSVTSSYCAATYLRTPVTGSLAALSCGLTAASFWIADVDASLEDASLALSSAALCLAASKTAKWSLRMPAAGGAAIEPVEARASLRCIYVE